MRWLFNLSFRHKIPLWTSFLISFSIFVVGAALMTRAYNDMKNAVVISADNLGHTLANTVAPTLLHDDVWRAFEIVRSPIRTESARTPVQVDAVVVLGRDSRVFVSSQPETLPMLGEAAALGPDWLKLTASIGNPNGIKWPLVLEPENSDYLYVALPVTDKDAQLGHLVLRYSRSVFHPWFIDTIWHGLGLGLLVLAVLIPINWYWGSRMAKPLVDLAQRMGKMLVTPQEPLPRDLYPYDDELGQLFRAYDGMVLTLRDKAALENEMVKSERLAAIGQLTAGIAHEINNPLAGLITVVDTLKLRSDLDPRVVAQPGTDRPRPDADPRHGRRTAGADQGAGAAPDPARPRRHPHPDPAAGRQAQDTARLVRDHAGRNPRAGQPGAPDPDQPAAQRGASGSGRRPRQPLAGPQGRFRHMPGHRRTQRRRAARRRAAGPPVRAIRLHARRRPRPRTVGDLPDRDPAQRAHHCTEHRRPGRVRGSPAPRRRTMQHRICPDRRRPHHRRGARRTPRIRGFRLRPLRDGKSARRQGLASAATAWWSATSTCPTSAASSCSSDLLAASQPLPPFIFITGYGAIDQAVRLLKLGAQDYVTKPFNVGELIAKIRNLCERQQPVADAAAELGISTGMRQIESLLPRLAASR
jgi:hypothetical protein